MCYYKHKTQYVTFMSLLIHKRVRFILNVLHEHNIGKNTFCVLIRKCFGKNSSKHIQKTLSHNQ